MVRPPTRARSRTPRASLNDVPRVETPEARYATCLNCAERGFRDGDTVEWWRHDPDSQWFVEEDADV